MAKFIPSPDDYSDVLRMRRCPVCREQFLPNIYNKKFCCSPCQREQQSRNEMARRREVAARRVPSLVSTGTVGAIGEMIVCADLMRRGYYVFRCVGPHSPVDLVIMDRTGKTRGVEVKTFDPKSPSAKYGPDLRSNAHFHIVACVCDSGVVYDPDPDDEWAFDHEQRKWMRDNRLTARDLVKIAREAVRLSEEGTEEEQIECRGLLREAKE